MPKVSKADSNARKHAVQESYDLACEIALMEVEFIARGILRRSSARRRSDSLCPSGAAFLLGISSFEEFLDRIAEVPEEELASYDGQERKVEELGEDEEEWQELIEELGFTPTVAYRRN